MSFNYYDDDYEDMNEWPSEEDEYEIDSANRKRELEEYEKWLNKSDSDDDNKIDWTDYSIYNASPLDCFGPKIYQEPNRYQRHNAPQTDMNPDLMNAYRAMMLGVPMAAYFMAKPKY